MAATYAEQVRAQMNKKAEQAKSNQGNSKEYVPDFGSVKVRLLPPVGYPKNTQFYYTHSFHFIEDAGAEGKGKFLWTPKFFETDEGRVKDPIDKAVDEYYKTQDPVLKTLASKIKRKRHFFMRALLLDEPDPEKKFIILKDNTADGKLMRKIASIMGIPFMRDVEDEWWDKASLQLDEDKKVFDLLDPDEGYDLKIVKKKTGNNPWDISYDDTFAVGSARSLTEEEKQLMNDNDINLETLVTYETNLDFVEQTLNEFVDRMGPGKASNGKVSKPKAAPKPKIVDEEDEDEDEVSEEELLNALG